MRAEVRCASESEKDFQQATVDAARRLKWRCYHPFDSRRSEPGWPDLICIRGPRLIAAELKTQRGKVSEAQRQWLEAFQGVTQIDSVVWRPSQWESIVRELKQ